MSLFESYGVAKKQLKREAHREQTVGMFLQPKRSEAKMSVILRRALCVVTAFLFAGLFAGGPVFGPQIASASQIDVSPGVNNVPVLPVGGLVNVVSPAVTPGVVTTCTAVSGAFDPLNTLSTTNVFNEGTVWVGGYPGAPGVAAGSECVIFWGVPTRVVFSGLDAQIQYIRIWGDPYDRVCPNVTVYSIATVLTGADLLDPAKYETTALATAAVAYNITPTGNTGQWDAKGQEFAITTSANTKSILLDLGSNPYWPRMYEIQAFGVVSPPYSGPVLVVR